jgi:hypothetical protein
MLEIKNVVTRDINGIPKKEYWVQMQLQMEVCQLDECDFLETKFIEYDTEADFQKDTANESFCVSKDGQIKGIILYFHEISKGSPLYIYKPLNIMQCSDIDKWIEQTIQQYTMDGKYSYVRVIYWKLEVLSCVLVVRNKDWFEAHVSELEELWKIVESERISGCEHRAPNKRAPKEETNSEPVCHIVVKKIL